MLQEHTEVCLQEPYGDSPYRLLGLRAPGIAARAAPGQFVHLRIPELHDAVLRRPFSIFRTDGERLDLLYKPVGRGTEAMRRLEPGSIADLLGPLGNGFPSPSGDRRTLLAGGGYGGAALYRLAERAPAPGDVFLGGRTDRELVAAREFEQLGWTVHTATEDGSAGRKGLVTDLLRDALESGSAASSEIFACGPIGMMRAVAGLAAASACPAWVSLDRTMACGVGACQTCVIRVVDTTRPEGWRWARCCREGPVFEAQDVLWENPA
ncbi:dihydroorotate dehydrogenase electron transfer subunit [Kiritimatiella glycovorans]|uniref:Dihydroorotate oxidase B, electron transfer subunit n=1 Tax=Kiritimatiella glycovorans TaxID=1307763 RepID=A0A0G3EFP7_9BACT|nr:dihydroorotate dehydrogenase electron transfer subunit [Kiritimatiella glycovorans]AKJ65286.1 Dihydroorotate oxidase B, electron transfer subunit [Kiritimatiella glycovorans]